MTRLLVAVLLCLVLSASACTLRLDHVETLELRPGDPVSVWEWREL